MRINKDKLKAMILEAINESDEYINSGSELYDSAFVELKQMFNQFKDNLTTSGIVDKIASSLVEDENLEHFFVEETFEILCDDLDDYLTDLLDQSLEKQYQEKKQDTTEELVQLKKELEL